MVYSILGDQSNEEGVFKNYIDLAIAFDDMINLNMRNSFSKN